jgi:microcystin-dependent protein
MDFEKFINNINIRDAIITVLFILVIYVLFRSNPQNEKFDTIDNNTDAIKNLAVISKEIMTTNGTLNIPANNTNMLGSSTISGDLNILGNLNILPRGVIVAWNNTITPVGWAICDGTNETPDLRGRFVLGSTTNTLAAKPLANGLSKRTLGENIGGEETHILTIPEIPSHNHAYSQVGFPSGGIPANGNDFRFINGTTSNTGGDMPHNNMPPFYVLVYIMKL